MIDFHTHILPQIDDGAKKLDASLEMLAMQRSQGVEKVLLTPHYYGRQFGPKQFLEKRLEAFERLRPHIPEGIKTRLGAEVHFTGVNVPDYEELCSLAIEGTKYILIEFPFNNAWTGQMFEKLSDFIADTGYTPIIAHIERYQEIWRKPALVKNLSDMGCLLQVNARAFTDKRDKKLAFALLKHGFVHCIGSDAHDATSRPPNMSETKSVFREAGLEVEWEHVQEMMRKVLADERVFVHTTRPIRKIFGVYF